MTSKIELSFETATSDDFEYLYALCDLTMRAYVETVFGDHFEQIARSTISTLLTQRLFQKIYFNDVLVGAIAVARHETHFQLEELYIDPLYQKRGIGTLIVRQIIAQPIAQGKPIRLNVLSSNSARAFYEKRGFSITNATPAIIFMERRSELVACE